VLLRNISISRESTFTPPGRPEVVAARVDDDSLAATLRNAQPATLPGVETFALDVHGIGCPTVALGRGRPILCVHGLGHDSFDWTPFFVQCTQARLAGRADVRTVALDLPGFGLADKPADAKWDLQMLVDAVLAAARSCGEPPVVVASSLGGHVAILAALQDPFAFARLFLCAPGGLVNVPSPMQSLLRAYYSVDAIAGRPEGELVTNSRKIFATGGSAVDDVLAARKLSVRRSSRAREFAVPFAGYVDDVFRHVVLDRMRDLRVPVAILVGERDVVVPPQACAEAARAISCRFTVMPNVGHCPHLEAPAAFADAVLSFVAAGNA
jgi:pimeloyl-ACP methyl ester carboxylesterase